MQVTISGKHMDTGEALKSHIEENLTNSVQKYFENAIDAKVVLSKRDPFFHCHISVNEGVKDGVVISADGEDADVYTAFNSTLDKAEKQLRRYKRKLKDRSHKTSVRDLDLSEPNEATGS